MTLKTGFYIHPTVSGTITGVYIDDSGRDQVTTKHFEVSDQVPYGLTLEDTDKGVFSYYAKLSITPDGQPLPSPVEEQIDKQPDPTLLPNFEAPPLPQAVLGGVPQYEWYNGCAPTGVASIIGYWDQRGYDNLFTAQGYDAVRETKNVQDEISSPEHNAQYGDGKWLAAVDKFWLPDSNSSIADYLGTSRDGFLDFNYGNTASENVADGILSYTAYKGYDFEIDWKKFADFSWTDLKAEIDNGRPILASVDAPQNGSSGEADHAVPILGYSEVAEGNFYYFYTNWSEGEGGLAGEGDYMRAEWKQAEPGVKWGVEEIWTVRPQSELTNDVDLPPPPPPPPPPPDDMLIA